MFLITGELENRRWGWGAFGGDGVVFGAGGEKRRSGVKCKKNVASVRRRGK